ncbi:MAG TPA: hypothetical protein VMT35_09105 [Ignavibacteriaceae bacterium]|nr:hypothetical protein [Ignavibacteriaceae bacterium]
MKIKTAEYSGTSLANKLGIKENFRIKLINEPEYYFELFTDMPRGIEIVNDEKSPKDLIHYFSKNAEVLFKEIKKLKKEIKQDGIIWISWPKRASGVQTDVTEDFIRDMALKIGLVDIKVCAVDEVWSALKLVIPVKERSK